MTTILYADDDFGTVAIDSLEDPLFYEALMYALIKAEIEDPVIQVTANGAETYKKLCNEKFDGLILDIMLPQGEDAPDFIKSAPFHRVGLVLAEALSDKKEKLIMPERVLLLSATPIPEIQTKLYELCQKKNGSWVFMKKPALFESIASFFKGGVDA
jgi:hypothetical protein